MKKKGFQPFSFAIDNAKIATGSMIGVGMVSKIGETLPSPLSNKIIGGMEPIAMLPSIHAAGGVFQSLSSLEKQFKKKRK